MGYLDYAGLQYLWGKLKEKFAPKSHSHDDRYYTESEMDGKLNSKVNNNEAGANGLLSKLSVLTATPTDDTYFMRQDTDGRNFFGRVKFSTLWNYIKGKADGTYQPKGSYAASAHTHDDRYYTETEINSKLNGKAVNITLSKVDLNTVKTPGFYNAGGGNGCTNVPVSDAFGLIVTHNANGEYYTQIFFLVNKNTSYRRYCNGGTWSGWTQDKFTDTNTWRGIQNNLTSDSTTDSLSAAQGKALKGLVDGKAAVGHKHNFDSITDKPSSYPPSAHNQAWSTITDTPALMTASDYSAETIEALLKKVQGTYPKMGSAAFTKDTHVANTWWNFIYTPHRTGVGGDNGDYGTLLLFPMTGNGSSYIIRASKSGVVADIRKIYTSGDKPTKGDVGLGNVDNTADANKSVKYAASAGSASTATKATTADNATTSKSLQLLSSTRPISMNFNLAGADYLGKVTYQIASSSTTTGKPPHDSGVLNFSWDNSGYGAQVAVENNNNPHVYIRGATSNNGTSKWDTNWKTVAFTDDKPATAGTADKANALNPTFTFNCEGTNVTGYRLIGQVSIGQWSNYRCVMLVKSRHTGAGIVTVTIGNNTSSITQANAYAEIKYWGPTGSGDIISGSSYQVWVSADGKTGYLFWQHTDHSPVTIHVISSDFALKNGTWMTGIGTGYGKCIATTQINAASTANTANSAATCTGNSASATKLTSSAGSATQPVYFKDGKPVAGTYTLGDASSKIVRSLSAQGNSGWANQATDDKYVPTMSFMAYWNGAYGGSSSNLQYCDRGRFGTIVTKSTADFAPASGSNDYVRVWNSGTVSSTDNASINDLAKQHFAMAMVNNATDNPLGAKKWIHAINMAWTNGVNSSWVSQIALGVQDSYGMWFRTGQGAITGRAWNRVYDSSYHPDADHASAADSATNATNATTATKLSSNAGSKTQPVYFSGGKPVAIGYTISSSVPANAKFTDTTYGVASSSSNGLMSSTDKTKLDDFSRVISIQKQIKLTTDWQDTDIAGTSLDTGTYVVQVSGFNSSYTQLYSEIYSGVMSWYSGTTNSGNSSEIFLHNAGLADNNNAIYLRTLRVAGSKTLKLQIACKVAATGTDTLTFKFRRLI